MVGFCKCGTEPSDSIKCGDFDYDDDITHNHCLQKKETNTLHNSPEHMLPQYAARLQLVTFSAHSFPVCSAAILLLH